MVRKSNENDTHIASASTETIREMEVQRMLNSSMNKRCFSFNGLNRDERVIIAEDDDMDYKCRSLEASCFQSNYNRSSSVSPMDINSMESHKCCCYDGNCDETPHRRKKWTFSCSFGPPSEKTPLVTNYEMNSYGITEPKNHAMSRSDTDDDDSGCNHGDRNRRCSSFKFMKVAFLCGVIVVTLVSFLIFQEKHEVWNNVVIRFGYPVYVNLTTETPVLSQLWDVKVKGPFIPLEYRNLTDNEAVFSIVKVVNDSKTIVKTPWIMPIAPADSADQIGEQLISHSFNLNEMDENYLNEYDSNSLYQLQVTTTDSKPIPIQISVSPYSKLSMRGIILSCVVLGLLYFLIVFEVVPRTLAAMIGATAAIACLTMIGDRPSMEKVVSWLDTETLSLLFGMMIIVAILCETGFFDYVAVLGFRLANGETWPLILILCLLTALLSAFLDNVTTVLLMTPVTIRLCEIKNIEPKHVLIAQVIFSNIGGAATPIGDPPNVIIISNSAIKALGVDFTSFTIHVMPAILVCLLVTVFAVKLMYRDLSKLSFQEPPEIMEVKREIDVWKKACSSISGYSRDENSVRIILKKKVMSLETLLSKQLYNTKPSHEEYKATLEELKTKYKIKNKPLLIKSACVLFVVIALFFAQSIPNVDVSLGWIAILGALALLILADFEELESIIARVEWSTLIFFAALFVVMEALAELKFLLFIGELTQNAINSVDKEHQMIVAICLILWVSAFASSFIDNIPFATVMVKIIEDLANNKSFNLPLTPLVYALAFGACLGGNGTLIGASANVVCAGVAEQHGYRFTFMDFFKIGFPVMLLTTTISNLYLFVCHVVFHWH